MEEELKKKQKIRFEFLKKLYELSGGDTRELVNVGEIAKAIGIEDTEELRRVSDYLESEGLIKAMKGRWGPMSVCLTHNGLREYEDAISEPDQPTQHFYPFNILYVERMVQSQIQQGTIQSTQSFSVTPQALQEITKWVSDVETQLEDLQLGAEDENEAQADMKTIKAQADSPKPKPSIIKEAVVSIGHVLQHAGGAILASQLIERIPGLLALLGIP